MTIRVLLADDQPLMIFGLRMVINDTPDIEVAGAAGNGREAVQLGRALRPDVIVMDIRMPEMDGIEATRQIVEARQDTKAHVLILTTFELDEYVYNALRAGASGFLLKDTPPEDLLDAIRVIARGDALLAPSVTRTLIAEFTSRAAATPANLEVLRSLTPREEEVLVLVARGRSNAEIADELHMSAATAKTHVSRILTKLGARDRSQLVVIAYESGLATAR